MAPQWLTILADISLIVAFICVIIILFDIWLKGYRQHMVVMNWVWPITALYFGPVALWAYYKMGRPSSMKEMKRQQSKNGDNGQDNQHNRSSEKPFWQKTYVGVTHCGAGCTLGDIIAEWAIFGAGFTLIGGELGTRYIFDYIMAYILGIIFQYFSIAPMRGLSLLPGIKAAIQADTLSLTAFEIGLFGWMALMHYVFFHPPLRVDDPVYWFMMQIGMIVGFFTSYPMNWFLIKKGIKEAM